MTCDFTSFSTVFQSYQGDGRLIMKDCVQWNSVYQSYWTDTISLQKFTKRHNSVKIWVALRHGGLWTLSDNAIHLYQVSWKYLEAFMRYWAETNSWRNFTKGHNPMKNVGGVTVLNVCTSSDHALYFLKGYLINWADTNNIVLSNTLGLQKPFRRWTMHSQDGKH